MALMCNGLNLARKLNSACKFLVQLVQHDVAQQWAQWSSLRSAFLACMPQSVVYDPASKVFVYKTDYPAVLDGAAEYLDEFAVAHSVKEAFKVKVNYIL